jgi:hypothetical protein
MTRRSIGALLAVSALSGLSFLASALAIVSQPHLRSARPQGGHIVVVYTLGDQAPSKIVVATRRATGMGGALLAKNVRLREPLPASIRVRGDAFRVRTRHTLRPGRYFVQVSATALVPGCTPHKPCPTRWSNVLPVRVTRR